jgi:hypothetical protein
MIKLGSHVMIKGADFKNWRGVVEKIDFHSCSVKFPNFLPRWYFESEVMEIADFKEGDLVRITDCGRRIKPEFAIKLVGCEGRIYSVGSEHLIVELCEADRHRVDWKRTKQDYRFGYCFDEITHVMQPQTFDHREAFAPEDFLKVYAQPNAEPCIGSWVKLKPNARVSDPALLLSYGFINEIVEATNVAMVKFVDRNKTVPVRLVDLQPYFPTFPEVSAQLTVRERIDPTYCGLFTTHGKNTIKDYL